MSVAKNLLAAIVQQAVEDYRELKTKGIVVDGRFAKTGIKFKCVGYSSEAEVRDLLDFIGGGMDDVLSLAGFQISGDAIRRKLFAE